MSRLALLVLLVFAGSVGSAQAAELLFVDGPSYPVSASQLIRSDLNGDGKADLVVVGLNSATPFLTVGDGTLTAKPAVAAATGAAVAGTFTADTVPDLVAAAPPGSASASALYKGNGDGTFTTMAGPDAQGRPLAGDFDGDGKLDLVFAGGGSAFPFKVYGGDGNGGFALRYEASGFLFAAADVNGDGRSDLLRAFNFLLGNPDGTFTDATAPAFGASSLPRLVSDVTGDGTRDIVNVTGQSAQLAAGTGGGNYGPVTVLATLPGNAPRDLAIGDVDADGDADIVVTQGTTVSLLRNAPGGFSVTKVVDDGVSLAGVAISDFNGDGAADLALAEENGELRILFQLKDSTPPSTSDDVDAAYHPGPVPVTLTATDAGAGVAATYYTTGGDPPVPTTASAVYDPAHKPTLANGEVIRYFSVDRYDNAEPVRMSAPAKVDEAVPDTALNAAPPELTRNARPRFAFSTQAPEATLECAFDDEAFAPCTSPLQPGAPLSDGPHVFRVHAVSRAGIIDPSPAQTGFTVDTVAPRKPRLTFGPKAKTRSRTARFFFIGSDDTDHFTCRLDNGRAKRCTSPATRKRLARRRHTFRIIALDAAGNASAARTVHWRIRR